MSDWTPEYAAIIESNYLLKQLIAAVVSSGGGTPNKINPPMVPVAAIDSIRVSLRREAALSLSRRMLGNS